MLCMLNLAEIDCEYHSMLCNTSLTLALLLSDITMTLTNDKTCDDGLNSGHYTQSLPMLEVSSCELDTTHQAAKRHRQCWHPASELRDLTIGLSSL